MQKIHLRYIYARFSLISLFPMIGMGVFLHSVTGVFVLLWLIPMMIPSILIGMYLGRFVFHRDVMNKSSDVPIYFKRLGQLLLLVFILQIIAVLQALFIYHNITLFPAIAYLFFLFHMYLYFCALSYISELRGSNRFIFVDISLSISIYILLNLVMTILHIENPIHSYSFISTFSAVQLFDIPIFFRTILPLTYGVNSGGIVCSIAACVGLFNLIINKGSKRRRIFYMFLIGVSMYLLLLTNQRMAIVCVLSSTLFIFYHKAKAISIRWAFISVVLIITFPFIWNSIYFFFEAKESFDFLNQFARNPNMSVFALGNRVIIWDEAFSGWANFDFFHKIFGYGMKGQISSGISSDYSFLFSNILYRAEIASVHNDVLQILLNNGIIGLVMYSLVLSCYLKCIIGLQKTSSDINLFFVITFALALLSIMEVTFVRISATFCITLLIGMVTITSRWPAKFMTSAGIRARKRSCSVILPG